MGFTIKARKEEYMGVGVKIQQKIKYRLSNRKNKYEFFKVWDSQ